MLKWSALYIVVPLCSILSVQPEPSSKDICIYTVKVSLYVRAPLPQSLKFPYSLLNKLPTALM